MNGMMEPEKSYNVIKNLSLIMTANQFYTIMDILDHHRRTVERPKFVTN